MRRIVLLLLVVISCQFLLSQTYPVSGIVLSKNTKEPVFYATVFVKGTNNNTYTDLKGQFTLQVPKGKHTLVVTMLGYAEWKKEIEVVDAPIHFVVTIEESSLQLDDVVVTAKSASSNEGSSAHKIGTEAIKQIQAFSLSDIMSLLPGGTMQPKKLTSSSQINLRSVETSSVNSFGTSIIVDGAPISNDANMQVSNPSQGLAGGTNVAGRGIDTREIPASNIESVEVVTGVASAKYGNITSGTVIVTQKAGYAPLNVSFNSTPTTYQLNMSRGFKLKKLGYLNADVDYAYSVGSPVDKKYYYQRVGASLRWTTMLVKSLNWNNTASFSYSFNGDGCRKEAEEVLLSKRDIRNSRYMLNLNGRMNLLGSLNYTLNFNATTQYTKLEQEATDGPRPLVEPTASGTYFTTFTPLSYMQTSIMKGLPLNIYGRIESNQNLNIPFSNFNFSTGVEYSFDKNYGKGRLVGGESVGAAGLPGSRGMLFHEIPASKTFSAYHQLSMSKEAKTVSYNLHLGLRYDNMLERYHIFSPRLSGMVGLFKDFKFRAAWGLSYKAPSMITLYPGPTYFDMVNLTYYATDPAERLSVVTSFVRNNDNSFLKPGRGETVEGGFEYDKNGYNLRLTGFYKALTRGIESNNALMILECQQYRVVSHESGKQPIVEPDPDKIYYLPRTYSAYSNSAHSQTKGLELTFSPRRIARTNTSFNLTGQYIRSRSWSDMPSILTSNLSLTEQKLRYGVYNSFVRVAERANANATIIQQIPVLRLMITFTTELNIYNKSSYETPDLKPVGYYDTYGNYIDIEESHRQDAEYADLQLNQNTSNPTIYKFYPNFHLNIRKETKNGHSFTFYANNCFWYNPYYELPYSKSKVMLNNKISFGFGITLKL